MVLSSTSDPWASGKLNRWQNQDEMDESIVNKSLYSIPVQPIDALTDTDKKIDVRLMPGRN
jgi:hypothetical protein